MLNQLGILIDLTGTAIRGYLFDDFGFIPSWFIADEFPLIADIRLHCTGKRRSCSDNAPLRLQIFFSFLNFITFFLTIQIPN